MFNKPEILAPVRFNPFKHHRNYILSTLGVAPSEEVFSLLEPVCNNYIDIYIGMMSPEAICAEVVSILKSGSVFSPCEFSLWLDSGNGYCQIVLHDKSEWVVRKSQDSERYIHIHPARTGLFTNRIKGSTLKTIYSLGNTFSDRSKVPELQLVNEARLKIGLSPLKRLERNRGILKCYEQFFNMP